MYSGSTLTNLSGSFLGTHQKVDRIARKALKNLLTKDETFPSKRLLLHFEGKNGPDGMKAKSAGITNLGISMTHMIRKKVNFYR